jgi:hypothetical protein
MVSDVFLFVQGDQETVFHRHSEDEVDLAQQRGKDDGDLEEQAPPASALTRRRALVPPKLLTECADDRKLSGYVVNNLISSKSLTLKIMNSFGNIERRLYCKFLL